MTMMKNYLLCFLALAVSRNAAFAFTSLSPTQKCVAVQAPNAVAAVPVATMDNDVEASGRVGQSELALLLPGQTLRIRVGDVSSSRKAWKKRRRKSSPILIPCSVLGMNREWMVRWNVLTLLHAIGEESPAAGGDVAATAGKIGRAYRKRLGGGLQDHAAALGYDTVESMLQSLFSERIKAEYGIRTFVEAQHGNLMLATGLTRRQARKLSSSAGMVQFRPETPQDGLEGDPKMMHTGMASVRLPSSAGKAPKFSAEPLGVALRVPPDDEATRRYEEGDEFSAFVYSYDAQGDHEGPLLVLSAEGPRGRGAALGRAGASGKFARAFKRGDVGGNGGLAEDASIERELNSLAAGDGPFDATVVAVSPHSSAVFVDCGVGRKRGKKHGGGIAKVLGMLRFEDINHGSSVEDLEIKAGDEIQVYIKVVSRQSGRFMVTRDPYVKNKKPKEKKREKQADKRKERLEKQISRDDLDLLIGNIFDGVVKAKSKVGDWYYVQPCVEEGEGWDEYLPVGIASFADRLEGDEEEGVNHGLLVGDRVRVRLDGVDERRGQLALTLLG